PAPRPAPCRKPAQPARHAGRRGRTGETGQTSRTLFRSNRQIAGNATARRSLPLSSLDAAPSRCRRRGKNASRPVSRVLYGGKSRATAIHLGRPLPDASRNLPGRLARKHAWGRSPAPSLFGLAPGGVYHAGPVAGPAVGSYPTLSP